ncbi:winged helix-turn-helix domain-containing protein [Streptomyces sp. NPDC094038]|uniref:winged helix-turn-helix domain-containing protein n=1 Tax=Streptomyces sp. NPDC094038 TaxID=3366055 RepID=UPI00382DC22C
MADFLRRDIAEGTYPPGSQLPPAREIQERFQVADSTAQNAYRSLKQEELVYSVKGRGVFVHQAPEPGKHHGPITNYLIREEIAREARAATARARAVPDAHACCLAEGRDDGDNRAEFGTGLSETHVAGDRSACPPSWLTFCG